MAMRLTEVAPFYPQRCAIVPYIGAHHPNGFIDTGNEIDGIHIYLSVVGLAEAVRVAGLVPTPVPDVRPELEAALARVAEVEAERDALDAQLSAVYALKNTRFAESRKPGRPPKTREKVTANGG